MKKKLLALAALAAIALAPAAQAALIIKVNGTTVATDPTNTFTNFSGSVGGFNINVITATGVNAFGGNGVLMDNGSLNISTTGSGSLTIELIQTDLVAPGSTLDFTVIFTGTITNATVTRSVYADDGNTGAQTTLLGSTTVGNSVVTASGVPLSGTYSLTELISITATGPGAILSSDDKIRVPEPGSLALLGLGLLGVGAARRRRA